MTEISTSNSLEAEKNLIVELLYLYQQLRIFIIKNDDVCRKAEERVI